MKNKTNKQIFSENLTELLKSESMSKTQLAQKIGVNASTVTNWCKGKMFPRYEMLEAIARVFHIETHELLQNKSVLDCALEDFNERFLLPEPGFDEIFEKINKTVKAVNRLEKKINNDSIYIMSKLLNDEGRKKAIEFLQVLIKIQDYTNNTPLKDTTQGSLEYEVNKEITTNESEIKNKDTSTLDNKDFLQFL